LIGKCKQIAAHAGATRPLTDIEKESTAGLPQLPKRERTRRQIITSAIDVLSLRGIAQTSVQEVAAHAGMTTGTFYNHFTDKADVIGAAAVWIIKTLEQRAQESRRSLRFGAERVANGCHRYLSIARNDPAWAMLILELAMNSPDLLKTIGAVVRTDIRLGVRQKDFKIFSEAAAVDLVHGCVMLAMRYIASGPTPPSYERSVVATVLQGLGLPTRRALEFARPGRYRSVP
jgi:AcrR family transcriptional regulator